MLTVEDFAAIVFVGAGLIVALSSVGICGAAKGSRLLPTATGISGSLLLVVGIMPAILTGGRVSDLAGTTGCGKAWGVGGVD